MGIIVPYVIWLFKSRIVAAPLERLRLLHAGFLRLGITAFKRLQKCLLFGQAIFSCLLDLFDHKWPDVLDDKPGQRGEH